LEEHKQRLIDGREKLAQLQAAFEGLK